VELLFLTIVLALGLLCFKGLLAILGVAMHIALLPIKILFGIVLFALALPFLLLLLPFAILAGVALLVGGVLFGALCLLAIAP
jgi:hypothetical protein